MQQLHHELLRRAGRWGELALGDPADEEASLARARQLADSGNRGAALRQLERLERRFAANWASALVPRLRHFAPNSSHPMLPTHIVARLGFPSAARRSCAGSTG